MEKFFEQHKSAVDHLGRDAAKAILKGALVPNGAQISTHEAEIVERAKVINADGVKEIEDAAPDFFKSIETEVRTLGLAIYFDRMK